HHHISRRRTQVWWKHIPLIHHDEYALEPQREPARGNILPEKHPDEIVIAPTATKTPREILHIDLHDRAGVVRKSTRKSRIDLHAMTNTHHVSVVQYRLQIIDALRAQ